MPSNDFEFDTADGTKPPASAYVEDPAEAVDNRPAFDVEFMHPTRSGIETIRGETQDEALAAFKATFPEDTPPAIISIDPA